MRGRASQATTARAHRSRGSLADQLLSPGMRMPLILLLCLVIYLPAIANGFTMDDRAFALGIDGDRVNPMVGTLHDLSTYFGAHYYAGITDSSELYRPVTILSYALRHALVGDAAWVAHLVNILLHLGCVLLVWRLLLSLSSTSGGAALGALVFGLHAIHSEAVVGIVGRAELLAFASGASATLLCLRLHALQGLRLWSTGIAGAALFFVAFCSKESAVCWAPLLLVMLHARRMQSDPGARLLPRPDRRPMLSSLILVAPLLLFFYLRHQALAAVATPDDPTLDYLRNPLYYETGIARYATAMLVQGHALLQSLFPFSLSADYSHGFFPIVGSFSDPWSWLSLLVAATLLTALVLGLRAHRRQPILFVAVCCYLGFSFVLSNLLVRTGTIYGERTWYTQVFALSLFVAWMHDRLQDAPGDLPPVRTRKEHNRALALAALGLWVGTCSLVLLRRNPVWRNNATLFVHEARHQPRSARMKTAAAAIHASRGEHGAARRELEVAVTADPGYAEAWNNLGVALLNLDEPAEARDCLQRGLDARPRAVAHVRHMLEANLALACLRLHQYPQALDWYERASSRHPGYVRSRKDLDEALHALVQDRSAPLPLRHRASRLGRATWAAPTSPR